MQRLDTSLAGLDAAPHSIQLVTPIKSARKELTGSIDFNVSTEPQQRTAAIVRTGCIPCLDRGRRCGPDCSRTAVSQEWRTNSDLLPLYHGTWRERHGLHIFVEFALAPQRSGMFGSSFWKETVMQLVLTNAAIFHVASAIGGLKEHALRTASGQERDERNALAFGLKQCNRSISLLTKAAREQSLRYDDPGIALIVCVLFSIFEALYGDPSEALTHVRQGRRILWSCEQHPPGRGGSSIIDTATVRPVLGGLELQATCMSGRRSQDIFFPLDPLPLPDVGIIHNLEHANCILHVVYSNLLIYHQHLASYVGHLVDLSTSATQKHLRFTPWLSKWEQAFATFLFNYSTFLAHEDMQKAKVLKANHLLCNILAQVDTTTSPAAWEQFTSEFKAIFDLATAVLDTAVLGAGSSEPRECAQMPCVSFELWVSEPLFVCASRCTDPGLRRLAANLLNGGSRAHQEKVPGSVHSAASRPGTTSRTSSSSNDIAEGTPLVSRPPS